ncbi:MAG: NAD(P)/FAD-dependent oxidoreductase, partial [Candidatus Dormiibacterota bacterium]
SVGISEAQAREKGINVKVVHGDVANDTRGWIHGKPGGVIKVIADADRRVLVGATLVGPRSGELLNEISLALRTDASLDLLADLIHPFPSFGRIFQYLFHELAS